MIGGVITVACPFCGVMVWQKHDSVTKTYRRRTDEHKYHESFRCNKFHQHFIKIPQDRWSKYKALDSSEEISCFNAHTPYAEKIEIYSGSKNDRRYKISRSVVDAVLLPLLFDVKKPCMGAVKNSFQSDVEGSYRLTVEDRDRFDVILGFVATAIQVKQVDRALHINNSPKMLRNLSQSMRK